jgi:hypothetical protein
MAFTARIGFPFEPVFFRDNKNRDGWVLGIAEEGAHPI